MASWELYRGRETNDLDSYGHKKESVNEANISNIYLADSLFIETLVRLILASSCQEM